MSFCAKPIVLRPDLFTPLVRTPWAGLYIANELKRGLTESQIKQTFGTTFQVPGRIGESWEFSCDPELPSRLLDRRESLTELLAAEGDAILGASHQEHTGPVCELMIKYINANEPLSVQVHPDDNDPQLTSNECGKPESWYVMHAEPGAGFYMGFKRGVTKDELAYALRTGQSIEPLLFFHQVKAGTFFDLPPGTPHALGSGLTVLEPQRLRFGKSGKTYRMWDWNRKYRADGTRDDAQGKSRPLHIEESLHLVNPERQLGSDLVRRLEIHGVEQRYGSKSVRQFKSHLGWTLTQVLSKDTGVFNFTKETGYCVVLCVRGKLELVADAGMTPLWSGMTALIPHAVACLAIKGEGEFFVVQPSTTHWTLV